MAKKKILQDSSGQIWPVTVADCVYLTDGSKTVKKYIDDGLSGKSDSGHTHKYAGSSSAGGAATTALACTGNSATATTLQTGRTINGTSFNGSQNITTANWGTARTLTIGNKGQSVNGSGNVSWTLSDIMGRATTTSSTDTNKNKYTKFARIDISGGTYRTCAGTFDFVSVESGHVFGILTYYLRTGSAITSTSISLAWKTLTNTAYANSVVAVKVSDGVFDLYYKPINDWDTMSITNINSNGIGYITLYSNQSFTSSVTAAATSSLVNHSATAAKLTTARTITIGNSGKTFDGSGNVSWSLSEIGAAASSHGTHVSYGGNGSASTVSRSDHTHNYAGSSSAGGAANSANILNSNTKMDYGWSGLNYFNISGTAGNAAKANDTPTTAWWHIIRCNHANSAGYYTDIAVPFNTTSMYYKRITNGAVQNNGWVKILDSLNWSDYAAAKSHGTHLTLGTGSGNAYYGDKGNTAYTHSQAAHAPSNAQKNSDITKAEIEAKLTGTITSHNHSGTYAPASHGTHLTIGTGASNAAAGNHTHNYAGSSSAGGAATSANKVNTNLIIKLNGGSTEGTNLFTFNGSTAKTINITPSAIGAAASSHGTHVSYGGNGSATTVSRSDHTHSYVPTAGGTMTGNLIMNNNVPIRLKNSGGTAWGMLVLNGSNNFHVGGGYQDNNESVGNTYITAGGNMEYRVMSSGGCHSFYDNLSSGSARQIAELSSGNGFRLLKGSLYTLGGISIGSSGANIHFNQGAGYVQVGSANPLYLQTTASDSSSTATEIRCSKVGANSTYIPLRAYNLNATNAVYAKGVNLSSDRTLKENVKYISNANTINDEDITIMDCYNFIKDDLGLATYNYIDDPEKQQKIGFIAQDILYDPIKQMDNKIGQLIITKLLGSEQLDPDSPKLTYDVNNVLGVMLGSLQVASKKIESLEATVENLTKKIESLESKSKG